MKKVSVLLAVIGVFVVVGFLPSCQSTKSATSSKMLKFNFEKGRGYDYEMIMNMDQEVMGQPIKMDMTTYYSMDVMADDGNMKTITTTFDRFKMNMGVAGMNIDIDSDKPMPNLGLGDGEEDPMKMLNGVLGAIKGRKFSMKVNAEGKVEEVTGFKDMAQSITDSLNLDEKKRSDMMQKFNEQFNESNIKSQFERVLYIFPNKEVKVGDSWQKNTTPGGQMGGKYNSTYTVKEIEGDMVTLEEKSEVDGLSDEMKMSGEITGILVVDSKSGLVVTADQEMSMKTTANGMDIHIKGKTKIKGKAR